MNLQICCRKCRSEMKDKDPQIVQDKTAKDRPVLVSQFSVMDAKKSNF